MIDDEIYFDMDENMGSYYDFNLLDLIEESDDINLASVKDDANSNNLTMNVKNM